MRFYKKIGIVILILLFLFILAGVFSIPLEGFYNKEKEQSFQILNLVLYSTDNGGSYDKMKEITSTYYKNFPFLTTYYYCYKPDIKNEYEVVNDILYIRGDESYIPGILKKTISAFNYFKQELHKYQYVIRTNISTIIRFDLLQKELMLNSVDYGCSLCHEPGWEGKYPFSSGTSIILSPDIFLKILENKQYVDETVIDDVSIGKLIIEKLGDIKIKPVFEKIPNHGFYFVPNFEGNSDKIKEYIIENDPIIFYRNHNGDRDLDSKQMKIIVDILNESINSND